MKTKTKKPTRRASGSVQRPGLAFTMKPGHRLWRRFCNRLAGPEACDFKSHPTKKFTFKCGGGNDRSMATRILKDMGADVAASLAFFSEHGGHCDCEILFNVDFTTKKP